MNTAKENSDSKILIRDVLESDAERLVEIYSYYVEDTAVSFEYVTPSVEEFLRRIRGITKKFPYLVCEYEGKVIGYAYVSAYNKREAYDWTVTTSIYLDKDYRRLGAGTALYEVLEARIKEQGIVNALAGVAYADEEDEYLTHDSYKFHIERGYTDVATLSKVGKKFDKWYDLLWMQKRLI